MTFSEILSRFNNNVITKSEFIDEMYAKHSLLFEYSTLIKNTNISSIEITDDLVIATFRDSKIQFICIPDDKRLAPLDTINFSEYEKDEIQLQYKLIKEGDTIIDIGANLGWYSMHIASKFPNNIIHSFEPIPSTFEYLNKNIEINNLSNILTYNVGLSDNEGIMTLYFDPNLSVNASLKNVSDNPNSTKLDCKFTTLDLFCKSNHITDVDFIKCDVEGAELFSLKGANDLLSSHKPIVFCEMLRKWSAKFDYHPNDIISFMKKLGYSCYVIINDNLKPIESINDSTVDTNFIYLHNTKHAEKINLLVK